MSRFSIRNPYFIVVICLVLVRDRRHQPGADAGGSVPAHQPSGSRGGHVLLRHAARRTSKPTSPIRWSASSRWPAASITWNRARCWASASSRSSSSPDTSADADVTQLSNLALADLKRLPPGTLPPVVLKIRCLQSAGLPGDGQGRGPERNAASRHRPVPDPQSDRGGAGFGDSAVRSAASTGR